MHSLNRPAILNASHCYHYWKENENQSCANERSFILFIFFQCCQHRFWGKLTLPLLSDFPPTYDAPYFAVPSVLCTFGHVDVSLPQASTVRTQSVWLPTIIQRSPTKWMVPSITKSPSKLGGEKTEDYWLVTTFTYKVNYSSHRDAHKYIYKQVLTRVFVMSFSIILLQCRLSVRRPHGKLSGYPHLHYMNQIRILINDTN